MFGMGECEEVRERESRFLTTHQHILGYTVSFTLYDLHKMDSRQLKKTDDRLQKLSTTQKKETTQNTAKQNYPGSVDFYHTRPGNEVGLFYSSRAHTGRCEEVKNSIFWVQRSRKHERQMKGCVTKQKVSDWQELSGLM